MPFPEKYDNRFFNPKFMIVSLSFLGVWLVMRLHGILSTCKEDRDSTHG